MLTLISHNMYKQAGSAAGGSSRRRSTGTVGLKKDVAKEDTISQGGGAAAKVLVRVSSIFSMRSYRKY
jgi:hypothetical protein